MGKTIVHQGGPGAGQHTKMVNQILIASNMIGVCEALLYGYKAGLDLPTVLQSVASGAAGSWSLDNLGPRIIAGNFDPGFFVEHFIKDMGIALDEAQPHGLVAARPRPRPAALHRPQRGHGRDGTHALQLALAKLPNRLEKPRREEVTRRPLMALDRPKVTTSSPKNGSVDGGKRLAENVLGLGAEDLDLAGVDGRPDLEVVSRGDLAHRSGALERPRGSVEPDQESVARRLDLLAAEPLERPPDLVVVGREELVPAGVAEPPGDVGRADDVSEQDGRQDPLADCEQRRAPRPDAGPVDADARLVADHPGVVARRDLVDRLQARPPSRSRRPSRRGASQTRSARGGGSRSSRSRRLA